MRKALAFPSIDSFCIERDSAGGTGNLRALFENRHFFAIHSVSFPELLKVLVITYLEMVLFHKK